MDEVLGIGGGHEHSVDLFRHLVQSLYPTGGITRRGAFGYQLVASQRQFTLAEGHAVVPGATSSTQGHYFAWIRQQLVTFDSVPAQARVDSVIIRVRDASVGDITPSVEGCEIEVVKGTQAVSPVAVADSTFAPAGANYKPGGWYRLYDVRLNAGDTDLSGAIITPRFKYAMQGNQGVIAQSGAAGYPSATDFSPGLGAALGVANLGDNVYDEVSGLSYTYKKFNSPAGSFWVPAGMQAPIALLSQTSPQNIPASSFTELVFHSADRDVWTDWNGSTDWVPSRPGWYGVVAKYAAAASTGGGYRAVGVFKNGAFINGSTVYSYNPSGVNLVGAVGAPLFPVYCNGTTDRLSVGVYQSSGGTLATEVSTVRSSQMQVYYLGPDTQ